MSSLSSSLGYFKQAAAETNDWLSSVDPTFEKVASLNSANDVPVGLSNGNRDCFNHTVTTRPSKLLQSRLTYTACFAEAGFGISDGNYIRFNGADVAGKVVYYGGLKGFIALPNSSDIVTTSTTSTGTYLSFTRGIPAPITTTIASSGEITYTFTQPPEASLRNGDGSFMPVRGDTISVASSGDWMVAEMNTAIIRINIKTMEVVPFAPAFNHSIGIGPEAQTAISSDGRYAVVASIPFGTFRLYDLSTCASVPVVITGPVSCQYRDLWQASQDQISQFSGPFHIRFINNDTVSFYGAESVNGVNEYGKYVMYAPGIIPENLSYLAMGDSFASGEGDGDASYYEPGTDVDVNKCHLSRRSYPYLINAYLSLPDFHSVACSGARIYNVTGASQEDIQYPLSYKDPSFSVWTPGYRTQTKYINQNPPKFMTISVGGNDAGFAEKLTECVTWHFKIPLPTTCKYASDTKERSKVAEEIAKLYPVLQGTYQSVIDVTSGKTKIYVVGYPQFIKGEGGTCGINVHLNDEERYFVSQATHYMNQVIKAAAESAGVHYLDVEHALDGYNLCSSALDSYMAVNGVTEGNDQVLPWWVSLATGDVLGAIYGSNIGLGNESYHPNQKGHNLLAQSILSQTDDDPVGFAVCPSEPDRAVCPSGSNDIPLPDEGYFGTDAATYVQNLNTPLQIDVPDDSPQNTQLVVDDSSISGRQVHIRVDYLLPGSTVTVENQSTPTELGTFTVGKDGVLDTVVTIPEGVEAGIHTLHVLGKNLAGEQKDYYQAIFVPGPEGDINDNGIPDTEDKCGFVEPSGQDVDYDGIDDACDGYIGPAPSPPSVTLLSPDTNSTLSGVVQISSDAQDDRGIYSVQFKLDGVDLGPEITTSPYSTEWDTTGAYNGVHTLSVTATDSIGLITTVEKQVNVYNVPPPPTVEVTLPNDKSTVSGTIEITANASDTDGVAGVQFMLDGQSLGAEDTEAPYSLNWDTSSTQNGTHTISASVYSVNGQDASDNITVNVQNSSDSLIVRIIKLILRLLFNWFNNLF